VSFQKDAVDSGSNARAGQWLDKFGLATTCVALAARELHGMRDVEDDRVAQLLEDRERAHVNH
jgi:hypothetical protein